MKTQSCYHILFWTATPSANELFVRAFIMLTQIQTYHLLFVGDSQSHDGFHDRKNYIGPDNCQNQRRQHRNELNSKLTWIAKQKAVVARRVDCFRSEQPSRQCTPCTADTMHANHIERIVVAESWFQAACDGTENTTSDADPESGHRTDTPRPRRDGDKSRYGATGRA